MNLSTPLTRLIAALSITLALLGVVMVYSSSAFQTRRHTVSRPALPVLQEPDLASPALPWLQRSSWGGYSTMLFFMKQLLWTSLGVGALWTTSRIDYSRWRSVSLLLFLGAALGLLLVWSPLGLTLNGATSWLNLKWFTIQPAEFAKLALVIFLADLFSRKQETLQGSMIRTLLLFALPGLLASLVILQPDLGMATQMVLLSAGIWFLAGARIRHLVLLAGFAAILLGSVLYQNDNARRRIETFLNPELASPASRYQIEQAQIAMANGGLWGVGLGEGQQKMHFLPAPHTDFIFAIMGEELGFVSCLAVLLAYGALITAGLYVALRSPDLFGTLLAGGVSLMLALGVLINLAVVTGSIPTTGLPLPLLSYGGSSLVSTMGGLGIMTNVSRNLTGVRR